MHIHKNPMNKHFLQFIPQTFSAIVHGFQHPNEGNAAESVWGIHIQYSTGVVGPVN